MSNFNVSVQKLCVDCLSLLVLMFLERKSEKGKNAVKSDQFGRKN